MLDILEEGDVVEDTIVGKRRWSIEHFIVFKYGGSYYGTTYSVGSTEMQEESPWEYEDSVECIPMRSAEVTVTRWLPDED